MVSSVSVERSTKGKPDSLEIKFSVNRVFPYQEVRAFLNGKEVGLFSYRTSDNYIRANGTEVLPAYQKHGIGQSLWAAVIKKHNPKGITVCTVTEAGTKFVKKLSKIYPHLDWDLW